MRSDGGNLYGGSAQGVSGTSSGGVAVTGESSSGGRSLPVNVLGSGSGGASSPCTLLTLCSLKACRGLQRYSGSTAGLPSSFTS